MLTFVKKKEACTSIIDRDKKMADVQEEIEQNLELVGATAIEDKLQDDVGILIQNIIFYIFSMTFYS